MDVSCVCPSYGRLELLNEAVECFLRQDFKGTKELIICNDAPHIELEFDHPEVQIINLPRRFASLGEKDNYLKTQTKGRYTFIWVDDDISLPWRINYTLEHMINGFYKPLHCWFTRDRLTITDWCARTTIAQCCMTTKFLDWMGPYPHTVFGTDAMIHQKAHKWTERPYSKIPTKDLFYILNLDQTHYHLGNWPHETLEQEMQAWGDAGERIACIPKGSYEIIPGWKHDYVKAAKEAVEKCAPVIL